MRHRVAHRKLGRITPHRIALLRNLATALFERERIRTTLPKAKELRPYAERLITLAKRDDDRLHARRLVLRDIQDPAVVKKLFDNLGAALRHPPGRLHPHPPARAPQGRRRRDGHRRAARLGVQAEERRREGQEGKGAERPAKAKAEKKDATRPRAARRTKAAVAE